MKKQVRFSKRYELYDCISTMMSETLESRRVQRFEYEAISPKLHIIETYSGWSFDKTYELVLQILRNHDDFVEVNEIVPGDFIEVKVRKRGSESFSAYFDFGFFHPSERFIAFFSLGPSAETDSKLKKLINSYTLFDFTWFDNDVFNKVSDSIGDKFRIENLFLQNRSSTFEARSNDPRMESFASKYYKGMRERLPIYSTRYWKEGRKNYTVIENYYFGKFVFWGEDFEYVMEKTRELQQIYENSLEQFEKFVGNEPEYITKESEGMFMKDFQFKDLPTPIDIEYTSDKDVETLATHILNGYYPFRIFGMPMESEENYVYSYAFDKHIGNPIGIEFLPDRVTLYLYPGSCTNTIKRFLRNFQQFVDPNARLSTKVLGDDS